MTKYDRWSRDGMPDGDALRRIQRGIDATMRGVIADSRRGIPTSASMIPDKQRDAEEPRAVSGGTIPVQSPPGVRWIDQQVAVQDRIDHAAAIRQRIEAEWTEEHFQKGSRVQSEYDPFSPDRLKK
jgi:hypothetical protein